MKKYDEDKTINAAWDKMSPAKQKKVKEQTAICNKATKATKAALQKYEQLAQKEDKALCKLERLYGVKKGTLGGL